MKFITLLKILNSYKLLWLALSIKRFSFGSGAKLKTFLPNSIFITLSFLPCIISNGDLIFFMMLSISKRSKTNHLAGRYQ